MPTEDQMAMLRLKLSKLSPEARMRASKEAIWDVWLDNPLFESEEEKIERIAARLNEILEE